MAKKTKPGAAAPVPKTGSIPSASNVNDLDKLPEEFRAKLSQAVRGGRYYVAVIRLDTEFRQLTLQRYINDIPVADLDRILTLIRDDLKNVR